MSSEPQFYAGPGGQALPQVDMFANQLAHMRQQKLQQHQQQAMMDQQSDGENESKYIPQHQFDASSLGNLMSSSIEELLQQAHMVASLSLPTQSVQQPAAHGHSLTHPHTQQLRSASPVSRSMSPHRGRGARADPMSSTSPRAPRNPESRGRTSTQATTPTAVNWLRDNYELTEGVSLPRSSLYVNFVEYCADMNMTPMNGASFGKIIRQMYPDLKTRRLGVRGQSKYHYYGIAVRETAHNRAKLAAHQVVDNGRPIPHGLGAPLGLAPVEEGMPIEFPSYPTPSPEMLGGLIPRELVAAFVYQYHQHGAQIFEAVREGAFAQIPGLVNQFWNESAAPFAQLLSIESIVYLVCHCDDILYHALLQVLGGNPMSPLNWSTCRGIRQFACDYCAWVRNANPSLSHALIEARASVASHFVFALKNQIALNRAIQGAGHVVTDGKLVGQMVSDWKRIDFAPILLEVSLNSTISASRFKAYQERLRMLLMQSAGVTEYLDLAANLVQDQFDEESGDDEDLEGVRRDFLLSWSSYATAMMRDLTLRCAPSFGSFHALKTVFDEYIAYLFQQRISTERFEILQENALGAQHDEDE